jgi:3-isopropylmalate dehydratase small subunit
MKKICSSVVLLLTVIANSFANIFYDIADSIGAEVRHQEELKFRQDVITAIIVVGSIIVIAIVATNSKRK